MNYTKEIMIDLFVQLGQRLESFGSDATTEHVINQAITDNSWFTRADILRSVAAIRSHMLTDSALRSWLAPYPLDTPHNSRRIGVIMAGNLPLVGFFDMMCVLLCGHECHIKPSSKDSALILYICELLRKSEPKIPIYELGQQPIDAVIATGSDNTNLYFRQQYSGIPSLLRSSRSSVALLTAAESEAELTLLADDIFAYGGLGCRNVSLLLLPTGYDVQRLGSTIARTATTVNPKLRGNYLQHKALLTMNGTDFFDGDFFVMRPSDDFPTDLSEVAYIFYDSPQAAKEWICGHDPHVQCIVASPAALTHPRATPFGTAQSPRPGDYPDGVDVIEFLLQIV